MRRITLDELDDLAGNVATGRLFNTLESRRGIHLHNHRAMIGPEQIDPCDPQAHGLGRSHRGRPLLRRELDAFGDPAAMKVGSKLPLGTLAHHRGDNSFAHDETTNVGATGLADKFLYEYIRVEAAERFDDRGRSARRLREHDAAPREA